MSCFKYNMRVKKENMHNLQHKQLTTPSIKAQKPSRNKNWVTVRDKCPQINVQYKWHTFKKKNKKIRTDGRTNERTDGRTDGPIILCPKFYLGA